jgi:hypothetical protein
MDYCKFYVMEGERERWGRTEERPGREEKEEGKGVACRGVSRGFSLSARASRRWRLVTSRASTQLLPVSAKKTSANFAKSPLGKGDFWGGFQTANIWQYLLIETFSRILRNQPGLP